MNLAVIVYIVVIAIIIVAMYVAYTLMRRSMAEQKISKLTANRLKAS